MDYLLLLHIFKKNHYNQYMLNIWMCQYFIKSVLCTRSWSFKDKLMLFFCIIFGIFSLICGSVYLFSVHLNLLWWNLVSRLNIKISKSSSSFQYDRTNLKIVISRLTMTTSNYLEFPFILFAEILHFEIEFGIQIYQKISRSTSVLGTIKPFLKDVHVCYLDFKIPIVCSFLFFVQRLHILKIHFMRKFVIRIPTG